MAGFYQTIVSTRTTEADWSSLLATLRALDATAGFVRLTTSDYRMKKATIWTAPQITAATNALNNAPAASDRLTAQSRIDAMSVFDKALLLTEIDELNRLRTQPTTTFATITPAAAIQAVRDKAGTL